MIETVLLKIRRAETPFYRTLKNMAVGVRGMRLPLPGPVLPLFRLLFLANQGLFQATQWALTFFLREPLFRSRCARFGRRVHVARLPFILGQPTIHVGNRVNFHGKVDVYSGRIFDTPTLTIGDSVNIGHNVTFLVNREVVVEENVHISTGVRIMDSDAHPRDTTARMAGAPPPADEIKPVRIGKYAWIGQNSFIMKGVTIGEGAIVGAGSVVVTDVAPYTVVMGNPARGVVKGLTPPPGSAYAAAALCPAD